MTNYTVNELIHYLQAKETILKGSFSRASNEGFIDFTFSVSDIEKELLITEQTIKRLEQAKEDQDFYQEMLELFQSLNEKDRRKSLHVLKRVLELQIRSKETLDCKETQ